MADKSMYRKARHATAFQVSVRKSGKQLERALSSANVDRVNQRGQTRNFKLKLQIFMFIPSNFKFLQLFSEGNFIRKPREALLNLQVSC